MSFDTFFASLCGIIRVKENPYAGICSDICAMGGRV